MYAHAQPKSPPPTPQLPNPPSAPSLAQGVGCNLTVTWTAPAVDSTHSASLGCNLRSSPTGAGTWTTVSGVTSPYALSGLAAGVAIDVQLQSWNAAGPSTWSATSTLTTAGGGVNVPYAPGAPSLALGSGSNLTVTWAAPAINSTHGAATGYNLQFSPSGAGDWTVVPGVTSPYNLSGLSAGVAIDVQVQSANAAGASAWSASSTLTTAVPFAPNTPGAVSLAQGVGTNLTVTWTAPAVDSTHGAGTGFNLRSSPFGAGTWTIVSGVASPYTLSGLATDAAIDVQVQSSNALGTSAWSATSTLTTAGPLAPNMPSALALAQGVGSNLTVTWTAPAADSTHNAATGFNLRSSPSGAGTWTIVSGVTSPYTLSGLGAEAAIDVQLESTNAAGTSAWSAASTLTTGGPFAPNMPSALSLAQGVGSSLTVTWTAPAVDNTHGAATGFNLQSSPSGAGTWTIVSAVTSPYTLFGLAAGAATDVRIQSSNVAGTSGWSTISTLTTAGPFVPNTPSALSLAQGAGSNLTVTWTAPVVDNTHGAVTGFNLRSSPSGAGTWTIVAGVTSPYTLSGLAAGAAIDVQLQSSNLAGASAWSATSTSTTAAGGPYTPNAPAIASVTPPADGTNTKLTVTWTAPAIDGSHNAATGYNLRYSPSGAGTWTTVSAVTSPYTLSGLAGAAGIDVGVQGTNGAASPGAWSAITTGTTWGATVAPGTWVAAASQTHNQSVAPNGGANMIVAPAPTVVTGAVFAWSASNSAVPTTGLIAAGADGQTNGWGQYFNAPATAGTFYLWMLAQGVGAATSGAFVTSAITVS